MSTEFEAYLKAEGVKQEYTIPNTPQQNGVSERMNRNLIEAVRSMIDNTKLPHRFWAEALSTVAYLINKSLTKTLVDKTPFEAWFALYQAHQSVRMHCILPHIMKGRNKTPRPQSASSWDMLLRRKATTSIKSRGPVLFTAVMLSSLNKKRVVSYTLRKETRSQRRKQVLRLWNSLFLSQTNPLMVQYFKERLLE